MDREPFTVGDLRRHLKLYPDDYELLLPGGLTFYRVKQRGPELVAIEQNEVQCLLTDEFKARNPHVIAAFSPDGPVEVE